ncbi:MAG: fibronectin type III domain-containing protein [Anaerolineales bacterium]|nr:fibronectin type III domain-containing protein [Anaerolineales bacterium]
MKSLKCTLALTLSLTALLVPLTALATNILTNSGLNDPYLDIPGRTWNGQNEKIASGWQPFFIAAGTHDADLNAKKLHWMSSVQFALSFGGIDYHIEGNRSQNMWSSYKFDAGIYQQITGLTPGQGYGFDIPIVTYWRGPGYPDSNGKMVKRVGIDPTGGTDPTSPNVIWSATDSNDKAWVYLDVAATAQAGTITVFAKVQAPENDSVNHTDLDMVYFDAAHVAPVPTTTLTANPSGTLVNLNWSGSGVAPSWSLKGYEVQYREATTSNWTTLQGKSSTNTSGSFNGQAGHIYVVRARTWQKSTRATRMILICPAIGANRPLLWALWSVGALAIIRETVSAAWLSPKAAQEPLPPAATVVFWASSLSERRAVEGDRSRQNKYINKDVVQACPLGPNYRP